MTLRTTVLPLGFGLSAIALRLARAPPTRTAAAKRPPGAASTRTRTSTASTPSATRPASAPCRRSPRRPTGAPRRAADDRTARPRGEDVLAARGRARARAHRAPSPTRPRAAGPDRRRARTRSAGQSRRASRGSSRPGRRLRRRPCGRSLAALERADARRSRTTSPSARAARARCPAGCGERGRGPGAMLRPHAGDPGRARRAPLRRLRGPRARAPPARAARRPCAGGASCVVAEPPRARACTAPAVERPLRALGPVHVAPVPDGERFKTPRHARRRSTTPSSTARLGRDGLVVALGGGVVGDLAGFAAATYMRGVDWVGDADDAALDGRQLGRRQGRRSTTRRAKNLIGAFHQPRAVVIDPAFLDTLPPRELRSGAYEVLKCAILGDARAVRGSMRARARRACAAGTRRRRRAARSPRRAAIKAEVVAKRRARGRTAPRAEPRPHDRPRARGGDRATAASPTARRSAGGWSAPPRSPATAACSPQPRYDAIAAAVDHVGPRPPVSDLRGADAARRRSRATRRPAPGRVPFVLPTAIGRVEIHDDVARGRGHAARCA